MEKPHVIMIAADQLRYDVLGKGYTPNLDQLSEESICFDEAYCASPLCVPARGSIFTGLCPNSTGSLINPWVEADRASGYVKEGIDNLYDLMERNGWDCIHSGKQHLFTAGCKLENRPDTKTKWLTTENTYKEFLNKNHKRMPGGLRFRSPVPEILSRKQTFMTTCSNGETGCYEEGADYYFDNYFTDEAIRGLKKRNRQKPLFLSAMFLAPHPPFDIPQPWYSRYTKKDFCLPDNVGSWFPHQSPLQLYNVTGALGSHYTRDEWTESWRVYLGLVSLLDDCVGRLISELKEQGIYDDCLILFTSDHGEMLGSHRLFQKMCMYQESVKVPFYLRLPHSNTAIHIKQTISHIDILPTLCQYLNLKPIHQMEGISFMNIIEGAKIGNSRYLSAHPVFIQYDGNSCLSGYQRCIILGNQKLIMDIFQNEVFFELYDILRDPEETINLLYEEAVPKAAFMMYSMLTAHMEKTRDSLLLPENALEQFIKKLS